MLVLGSSGAFWFLFVFYDGLVGGFALEDACWRYCCWSTATFVLFNSYLLPTENV